MRRLRQIHNWLGAFFAPAILFFALSGALQTFSLHENKGGGPYKPPAWIVVLASVHKDQALPHPRRPRPPRVEAAPAVGAAAADADHEDHEDHDKGGDEHDHDHAGAPPAAASTSAEVGHDHGDQPAKRKAGPSPLPLKIFVLVVSIALFSTTLLGLWIALKNRSQRGATLILLAAGTVLPVLLLFL
jgi:hypothetical protein